MGSIGGVAADVEGDGDGAMMFRGGNVGRTSRSSDSMSTSGLDWFIGSADVASVSMVSLPGGVDVSRLSEGCACPFFSGDAGSGGGGDVVAALYGRFCWRKSLVPKCLT